jgi:hypothetical protein
VGATEHGAEQHVSDAELARRIDAMSDQQHVELLGPAAWAVPHRPRLRAPPAAPGGWVPDEEDLEAYFAELDAEIAAVRRDLEARRSQPSDTTRQTAPKPPVACWREGTR